jgi:hypothetical protein
MKVDVAGCINKVELIQFIIMTVFHPNCSSFDRNASLPLKFHVIEHLRLELTFLNGASVLQQSVGERTFAVIDVSND